MEEGFGRGQMELERGRLVAAWWVLALKDLPRLEMLMLVRGRGGLLSARRGAEFWGAHVPGAQKPSSCGQLWRYRVSWPCRDVLLYDKRCYVTSGSF